MMKINTFLILICAVGLVGVAQATEVYSDDFVGPDGSYNGNTTPNSPLGVPVLESYGSSINATIVSNALSLDDGGSANEGLSFGGTAGRFNWATSSFASDIVANGLLISFDVIADNGGSFISMGFGSFTGVPDGSSGFGALYDSSDMDWGYRAENDRMISFLADGTTTPSFRTDQDGGAYNVGNGNPYNVLLELQFDSFNTGATVTASSTITDLDLMTVVSDLPDFDTFTLGATDNFVFDFSSNNAAGNLLFDNLAISIVPEPSTFSLLALAGLALSMIRRR